MVPNLLIRDPDISGKFSGCDLATYAVCTNLYMKFGAHIIAPLNNPCYAQTAATIIPHKRIIIER